MGSLLGSGNTPDPSREAMPRNRYAPSIVLVFALAASGAMAETPLTPGAFAAYVEDGRHEPHHAPQALPRFDALMAAAGEPAALPDATLARLATDAADANFYFDGARVDVHRALFAELARRGQPSDVQVEDLHRSLLAANRWPEAAALAARHPAVALEALPGQIDAGNTEAAGPHVWRHDPQRDRLQREPFVAGEGVTLVVVSHPACPFSRAAMHAIEADADLAKMLPARRMFVAPRPGGLKLDLIGRWNAAHPAFTHVLVDRREDWSFVAGWNTPRFLFLVDGRVVAEVEGWPAEGRAPALRAASRLAAAN